MSMGGGEKGMAGHTGSAGRTEDVTLVNDLILRRGGGGNRRNEANAKIVDEGMGGTQHAGEKGAREAGRETERCTPKGRASARYRVRAVEQIWRDAPAGAPQ